MITFDLKITGEKEIMSGLDSIGPAALGVGRRALRSALVRARDAARKYPGAKSPSYKRTRIYYKSFAVIKIADGWQLTSDAVSNRGRTYTRFVGGNEGGLGQAWNNRHWPVIKDKVDEELENLVSDIDSDWVDLFTRTFG